MDKKQNSDLSISRGDTKSQSESDDSKRRLLTTLAAGSVVGSSSLISGSWTKPVVDTVILPAHGTLSALTLVAAAAAPNLGNTTELKSEQSIAGGLLGGLVTDAHAAIVEPLCEDIGGKCINFIISGGAGGAVSASIAGLPSANGVLNGLSLPAGFSLGTIELSGTFSADFSSGAGSITTCGIPWSIGGSCSTAAVTTEAPTTPPQTTVTSTTSTTTTTTSTTTTTTSLPPDE